MPDPITPDTPVANPIGDPQIVTPGAPTSKAGEVTPQTAVAPDNRPSIKILYVLATEDERIAPWSVDFFNYNYASLGANAISTKAFSWEEFEKVLLSYSSIDQLVILGHANGSDLKFGSKQVTASQMVENLQGKAVPAIKQEITLEGCTAGLDPEGLVKMARFFKVPVTGFNMFHAPAIRTVAEEPEFTTQEQAEQVLNDYLIQWQPYFLRGMPPASTLAHSEAASMLAGGLQVYAFPVEWWTWDSLDAPTLPIDSARFLARSSATDRPVQTDQEASALKADLLDDFDAKDRIVPLYRTVARPGP
jgi:hypothetical protein